MPEHLNLQLYHAYELSDAIVARWVDATRSSITLSSPFFHPGYVQTLGRFRGNVEVAVLAERDRPIAFFPFERHGQHAARPPGLKLCDFQGIVTDHDLPWSVPDLLRSAGLSAWHFDHLLADQCDAGMQALRTESSPFIDLSSGLEAYLDERRQSGSKLIAQTERKARKLMREVGPVEFQWHDSSPDVLRTLFDWKHQQRLRTRTVDVLQWEWVRDFMRTLMRTDRQGFSGLLSTLRVDGQLAAAHLGLATDRVVHWWIPSYAAEFSAYSPGSILLLRLIQESAGRQIQRIDLGKGDERYKQAFASGGTPLVKGVVDLYPMREAMRRGWSELRQWIENSPLDGTSRRPKAWLQSLLAAQHMGESS